MTTTTVPTTGTDRPRRATVDPHHTSDVHAELSFAGVVRGEWIKLLSLRSTWWTLATTVALMALIALAASASLAEIVGDGPVGAPLPHGAEFVTTGSQLGIVTVAVLGALLMTGEYSTGMVRSTLAAVPSRFPVLAAKGIVLTVVTVAVAIVSIAASYLSARPFLDDHGLVPALDDAQTWQVFGGTIYFFVATALLALGIATVLRHTAGSITAVLGLLLLLPGVLQLISIDWVQDVTSMLPLPASFAFLGVSGAMGGNELLTPWEGVGVIAAYAVVTLAAGAVLLRRRDA
ncbi:ABC transporter permease subunit [Georgenia muralis]|uniref:ABC-2 type transport system permease protein n=1 Tax=Georgenia muralis TaxID=154117 RepID=A0A3N4Z1B2_9MICO|nr:ABC transporter permease subunit [Georgenia muralis]RPF27079.1 ABC-2 type transport system permease protein [Georgenia muralis]